MPKRFTDTEKWKKEWYRKLGPKFRDVWQFLLDHCSHAGIWEIDLETLKHFTGARVSIANMKEAFGDRITVLPDNKLFVRTFFEFQYGTAKEGFKAKVAALRELEKHGLVDSSGNLLNSNPECPELSMDCPSNGKGNSKSIFINEGSGKKTEPAKYDFDPIALAAAWNSRMGRVYSVRGKAMPQVNLDHLKPGTPRFISAKERLTFEPRPEYWIDVIDRIARSEFCRGRNDRSWVADFEFLVRPETHIKVMEGKYGSAPTLAVPTISSPPEPISMPDPEPTPEERLRAEKFLSRLNIKTPTAKETA